MGGIQTEGRQILKGHQKWVFCVSSHLSPCHRRMLGKICEEIFLF